MPKNVYFVRHGECRANVDGVIAGSGDDSPLTQRGIQQARDTAQNLQGIPFDLIVASPLIRAKDTAGILIRELGASEDKLLIRDEFTEKDVGEFSGKSKEEYYAFEKAGGEAGESTADMQARVRRGLVWLKTQAATNILLVTHSVTFRMARTILEHQPAKEFINITQLANGEFYLIDLEDFEFDT